MAYAKIIESYLRNDEYVVNLIKFNELSVYQLLSTIKPREDIVKLPLSENFIGQSICNFEENESLKMLPSFFIKNLINKNKNFFY